MDYGECISKANNQILVDQWNFGSYQGDWIAITKDDDNYYVYKGWYGSCSGCDSLEGYECDNIKGCEWTEEQIKDFAKDYEPFIVVDRDTFENLVREKRLVEIMPANTRLDFQEEYDDVSEEYVFDKIMKSFK